MLRKLKTMLGFSSKSDRPSPDPIRANLVIALQRNERASEAARSLLTDMLDSNDGVKRVNK
jgi:hypothetical protein